MAGTQSVRVGRSDIGAAVVLLGLALLVLMGTPSIEAAHTIDPLGPRFLPNLLAVLLGLLSLMLLMDGVLAMRKGDRGGTPSPPPEVRPAVGDVDATPVPRFGESARRVLLFGGALTAYVTLLPYIGFALGSFLLFVSTLAIAGLRRPGPLILQAASVTLVLYILFGVVLGVELPRMEFTTLMFP